VARRRLGDGMVLERIREEGTMPAEPREAASVLRGPAIHVVRSHLVDREKNDQARTRRGYHAACLGLEPCRWNTEGREHGGEQENSAHRQVREGWQHGGPHPVDTAR